MSSVPGYSPLVRFCPPYCLIVINYGQADMTKDLPIPDEKLKDLVPLQRRGTEDDIGGIILYLASKVWPNLKCLT